MATRVLTMSARLAPMPEEPVFAQLKPVLGAREAPVFPGEDLKQQPPPQPQQQHPGSGGGGGGAALPGEEMVQTRCEMEKYLAPQLPPVPVISEHKKYRRDSASVVD